MITINNGLSNTPILSSSFQTSSQDTFDTYMSSAESTNKANWLVSESSGIYYGAKPNMKSFMDTAKASWDEAMVLYADDGRDTRDWTKIMSSADPLQAAREATEQMYNDSNRSKTIGFIPNNEETYTKTQNFVYYNIGDGVDRLALTDKNGVVLRQLSGSAEYIKEQVKMFGFDTEQLDELQSQLTAKNINSTMVTRAVDNNFVDLNDSASHAASKSSSASELAYEKYATTEQSTTYKDNSQIDYITNTTNQNKSETSLTINKEYAKESLSYTNSKIKLLTEIQDLFSKINVFDRESLLSELLSKLHAKTV